MKQSSFRFCLLLCLTLCVPFCALADTSTHERRDNAECLWMTTAYDAADFPADVLQALADNGLSDYAPENGVTLSTRYDTRPKMSKYEADIAVSVLVKDGTRYLAVFRSEQQDAWKFELFSDRAILQNRAYTLDSDIVCNALGQSFDFTYPCADGTTEIYRLKWGFSDLSLWYVQCYDHVDAAGKGIRIVCDYGDGYAYAVSSLPQKAENYHDEPKTCYPCYLPACFNWTSIEAFPTTEKQAKALSESSLATFPAGRVYLRGEVNLREKATSQSRSLGKYYAGTLAEVLSTSSGKDAPWYLVRIGSVEGYVSGVYASQPSDERFGEHLWHGPLPVAETRLACELRDTSRTRSVRSLPAGTIMQVMGYTNDGWLHVMIPREGLQWQMDISGTDGYVKQSEVTTRMQP